MGKRAVLFALAAGGVCFLAWVAGFNFNERGPDALMIAIVALTVGAIVAAYPMDVA